MHAEIIATGSELLLGEQVDTNSTFIARKLREIGLNLYFKTVVGDNEGRMAEALSIALGRSDVVITTGGLGPTVDDVTRPAVARATGRELIFRDDLLAQIEARFRVYGVPMGENNHRQAYVPSGAIPIENPVGTAPAFIVEDHGRIIISLPGVPREMEYLIEHAVLPYLREKLNLTEVIVIRTLHTVGQGESRIDEAIGELETASNPTVGLSAKAGQVDIRITAKAATRGEAEALIAGMEARVRERVGAHVFGADEDTLEGVLARQLTARGMSLASIEYGTGGALSGRLSRLGGAYRGGLMLTQLDSFDVATATRAAQDVQAAQGGSLGLAVLMRAAPDGQGQQLIIALTGAGEPRIVERGFGGHSGYAPQWASTAALGLAWRVTRDHDR